MPIKIEIQDALTKFPTLFYNSEKDELVGELFITKSDSYEVRIELSPYPELFPTVYETMGRIPNKVDRHIYSDTGSCCFTTRAKSQIMLKTKVTSISLFISDIMIPYFQNNSYHEINSEYKTEEHVHSSYGINEGYKDILQTESDLNIARLIANRVLGRNLTIRDKCYCGSGKSLKKCSSGIHDKCYRDFKKIDKSILNQDLHTNYERFLPPFNPFIKNSTTTT